MAKKKSSSWLLPEEETQEAAKSAIQKTTTSVPKPKPKPKKKMGRPKATEGETVKILVAEKTRSALRKLAALEEVTMIEYLELLINEEAKKKGIK